MTIAFQTLIATLNNCHVKTRLMTFDTEKNIFLPISSGFGITTSFPSNWNQLIFDTPLIRANAHPFNLVFLNISIFNNSFLKLNRKAYLDSNNPTATIGRILLGTNITKEEFTPRFVASLYYQREHLFSSAAINLDTTTRPFTYIQSLALDFVEPISGSLGLNLVLPF